MNSSRDNTHMKARTVVGRGRGGGGGALRDPGPELYYYYYYWERAPEVMRG